VSSLDLVSFSRRCRVYHFKIRRERIRWKSTHLSKLCKLRSKPLDLDPKARERGGNYLRKPPASPSAYHVFSKRSPPPHLGPHALPSSLSWLQDDSFFSRRRRRRHSASQPWPRTPVAADATHEDIVAPRQSRSSTRYGPVSSSAASFSGPIRKWRKAWVPLAGAVGSVEVRHEVATR
jgi:hypothetical protein